MANIKISQLERTTDFNTDAYVMVIQNGKNYRLSIKDAIAANVFTDNFYTIDETQNEIQRVISESNEDLLNGALSEDDAPVVFREIFENN